MSANPHDRGAIFLFFTPHDGWAQPVIQRDAPKVCSRQSGQDHGALAKATHLAARNGGGNPDASPRLLHAIHAGRKKCGHTAALRTERHTHPFP